MSQTRSTQTAKSPGSESKTQQQPSFSVPVTSIHKLEADGVRVFYRAAGDPNSPVVLLLHGFPTSSFMFRELIHALPTTTGRSRQTSLASDSRKFRQNENTPGYQELSQDVAH